MFFASKKCPFGFLSGGRIDGEELFVKQSIVIMGQGTDGELERVSDAGLDRI